MVKAALEGGGHGGGHGCGRSDGSSVPSHTLHGAVVIPMVVQFLAISCMGC